MAVEEEDMEVDLEEAEDSAEEDEAGEGDQAVAPLQEFVPFSCPKVALCVESANRGCNEDPLYKRQIVMARFACVSQLEVLQSGCKILWRNYVNQMDLSFV